MTVTFWERKCDDGAVSGGTNDCLKEVESVDGASYRKSVVMATG